MTRARLFAVALLAAACAEDVPGTPPPEQEVYFPLGAEVVTLDDAGEVLVVVNSNFDQRYNAGYVSTYSVETLTSLAGSGDVTTFVDSLEAAFISRVRIEQFGGDITLSDGTPRRVFVASRGRNVVTMIGLAEDGTLFCDDSPSAKRSDAFDCTAAHEVRTFADDPFPVAFVPQDGAGNAVATLAVGHLTVRDLGIRSDAVVRTIEYPRYEARVAQDVDPEVHVFDPTETSTIGREGFSQAQFSNNGGVAGLVFSPQAGFAATDGSPTGRLLIASAGQLNVSNSLTIIAGIFEDGVLRASGTPLALDVATSAIQTRGIRATVDGRRAYVGIRFQEGQTITQFNSGVAIVDTSSASPQFVSVFEVGEEGSRPSLVERADARLLYIPDLRLDRIFILDVTNDEPTLVGSIVGRANRVVNGEQIQARTLASPAQVAFTADGNFGFVTNFLNSTIAVLDTSDPDPRKHRVIARLGRNIDPEGDMEMPQ